MDVPVPVIASALKPLERKACALFDWLVSQALPALVNDHDDIDVLRMLKAAGLVEVDIPDLNSQDGAVVQPAATVQALTQEGRRWRERRGQPSRRLETLVGVVEKR